MITKHIEVFNKINEPKELKIEFAFCACGEPYLITRKDRGSCSNNCAVAKIAKENKKILEKAKKKAQK